MKVFATVLALFFATSTLAAEQSVPAMMSERTGANIASLSNALARHNKNIANIVSTRTETIVKVHRMAGDVQLLVDRQLGTLANTGGRALVTMFEALKRHGDMASSSQLEIHERTVRADVASVANLTPSSTQKLDSAAKKLSSLAVIKTNQLSDILHFANEAKATADALQKQAEKDAETGKTQVNTAIVITDPSTLDSSTKPERTP